MAEHLGIRLPPERDYQTLAGYVLQAFGRLPATGERIGIGEWNFEVVDLDGNRIDKVIASPTPLEAPALEVTPPAAQALAGPPTTTEDAPPALHRAVDTPKLT